jgi:hypothetical protein
MTGGTAPDDPLSTWLAGEGLSVLERIVLEALDIVGVLDTDLRIRYLNRTGPGMTREAALGRSVLDLTPPGYQVLFRVRRALDE